MTGPEHLQTKYTQSLEHCALLQFRHTDDYPNIQLFSVALSAFVVD